MQTNTQTHRLKHKRKWFCAQTTPRHQIPPNNCWGPLLSQIQHQAGLLEVLTQQVLNWKCSTPLLAPSHPTYSYVHPWDAVYILYKLIWSFEKLKNWRWPNKKVAQLKISGKSGKRSKCILILRGVTPQRIKEIGTISRFQIIKIRNTSFQGIINVLKHQVQGVFFSLGLPWKVKVWKT